MVFQGSGGTWVGNSQPNGSYILSMPPGYYDVSYICEDVFGDPFYVPVLSPAGLTAVSGPNNVDVAQGVCI